MFFASELKIPPWELNRLTYEQLIQGCEAADEQAQELEKLKQHK